MSDNKHTINEDAPDYICDEFTYNEFKEWVEELINEQKSNTNI